MIFNIEVSFKQIIWIFLKMQVIKVTEFILIAFLLYDFHVFLMVLQFYLQIIIIIFETSYKLYFNNFLSKVMCYFIIINEACQHQN